jgi:vacuolar-type H+-ATPase subunit H
VPPKVEEILDRFEYVLHHARHVPLSNQVIVDEDEVMELIDQLRFNLPDEIHQARWTVQEQQRLISEAHAEAARIMARATERAEEAVRDHEVVRVAERQASQTMREAQSKSAEIIREAESYALDQLKQLEAHLSRTLATVKRGVEALQSAPVEEAARKEEAATRSS